MRQRGLRALGLREHRVGALFFRGMHAHAHMGARVQVEELPLLLVGFIVHLDIKAGFLEPGGDAIGGFSFIKRRNGDKLFHRFAGITFLRASVSVSK